MYSHPQKFIRERDPFLKILCLENFGIFMPYSKKFLRLIFEKSSVEMILIKCFQKSIVQRLRQKIVHIVIKAPRQVVFMICEWVPPKIQKV